MTQERPTAPEIIPPQLTDKNFWRDHYHHMIYGLMGIIVLMMLLVGVTFYQTYNRPLPVFYAQEPNGKSMLLTAYTEPNLLANTITQWAAKAATVAYTYDYLHFNTQLAMARPYFTTEGWSDFLSSVTGLIDTIVANQLIINGVVSGVPVISNQGQFPGKGYVWRVQIPFLVTYQSSVETRKRSFYVSLTIVRVPTNINPQGIGIDQFVMTPLSR